jgi:hypothetical protein
MSREPYPYITKKDRHMTVFFVFDNYFLLKLEKFLL